MKTNSRGFEYWHEDEFEGLPLEQLPLEVVVQLEINCLCVVFRRLRPIRLFEKRINAIREPGYEFDKASLLQYNNMSFGGPPVTTQSVEEADELLCSDEQDSAIGNLPQRYMLYLSNN
ncbi:hypothetical protein COLO4_37952 [Corchorus olitorius]|uniref:Uncharacterized protein n=1 Tax=Corchorus olitorius TaxID=93759 RepID=A0A1R3FXU2_9ROSI|nr:hypothetical protein COLO4_37952 [Corchorus olitorius]